MNALLSSYKKLRVDIFFSPVTQKSKKCFLMEKINSKSLIDDAIFSFSIGDEEKAKFTLTKVLELDPENIDALRAISEVLLSLDDLELSELYCRRALEINPEDLTSTVSLARILVKKGDKDGAEDASAKARILGWKEELASESDEVHLD
ncbi:MAG: hypothetical protein HN548_03260 [Opitutae bacterium]|jgi:tetratricopeptide (TPR) repeat protein|nr:hypothetical protein [Opitutae bacterium]